MSAHDLVVRGGLVVDGTGRPGRLADVAVDGGVIVAVGRVEGRGRREVDAEGLAVTPGFVDGHTHYDAQVWWDGELTPSSQHGTTSVVMGHCGFSLAPVRAGEEHLVVRNLERAEAIPAEALAAGVEWRWERFRDMVAALEATPTALNCAVNVGHSALRTWAMGERAFDGAAGEDDLVAMERELVDAIDAGAVGFTTSRSPSHETSDDRPVASRLADWSEVERLTAAMARVGGGLFQFAQEPEARAADPEVRARWQERILDLLGTTGVAATWGIVARDGSEDWRDELAFLDRAAAAGTTAFGLVQAREISLVLSFRTHLPFDTLPAWQEVRRLPLDEQRRALLDPDRRRTLVDAAARGPYPKAVGAQPPPPDYDWIQVLGPDGARVRTLSEEARLRGTTPLDAMLDLALEGGLEQLYLQLLSNRDETAVLALMQHPRTAVTFSDAGAHVTQLVDASLPTHVLSHWVRDREAFTFEEAVRLLTSDVARHWGFADVGTVAVGRRADLNVLDPATVAPGPPEISYDLPGGSPRLVQSSAGIAATLVGGVPIRVDGEATGERPGRLLRRARPT